MALMLCTALVLYLGLSCNDDSAILPPVPPQVPPRSAEDRDNRRARRKARATRTA